MYNPLSAKAEVLDYDGNYYIVNMVGPEPEPTEERELTIYNAQLTDMTQTSGAFVIDGCTSDSLYYFVMSVYSNKVEGEYMQDDVDFNYTYVGDYYTDSISAGRVIGGYHMIALDATVTQVGDDYQVEARYLGQCLAEGVITPLFTIHMTTADKPTALPNVDTTKDVDKILYKGRVIIMNKRTKYDILGSKIN